MMTEFSDTGSGGPRWAAIVPAAGLGIRMEAGRPKQYLSLAGRPVLIHTLSALTACEAIEAVVVVAARDELETVRSLVEYHNIPGIKALVVGGDTRQESVINGTAATPPEFDYLLVHDAVRPLVTLAELEAVMTAARRTGAATLGVPARDTLARVDRHHQVTDIPPRSPFWHVQTPQACWRPFLVEAQARAGMDDHLGTDEAGLILRLGRQVEMVEGSSDNLKITTPADLEVAEVLLRRREKRQ